MIVEPLPRKRIETPPQWVLQTYYTLLTSPKGKGASGGAPWCPVSSRSMAKVAGSSSAGKQFSQLAVRYHLAVRARRGEYVLVDPAVTARCWAIPSYYAALLSIHDALTTMGIEHAFACLAASEYSDYVPERPLVVAPPDQYAAIDKVEHFSYRYREGRERRIETLGAAFDVPVPTRSDAALLLMATGLPREKGAARELLHGLEIDGALAAHLNSLGYHAREDVHRSRAPDVRLPPFIEERRQERMRSLLQGER